MEIQRDGYLNKLIKGKGNGLVKIITGIRGCGKSYLLDTIFARHLRESGVPEDHIIRFAFDSEDDLKLIGESPAGLVREKRKVDPDRFTDFIRSRVTDRETYYLLLDEVQEMDCFETVLNAYLRKDNMDLYVTGSSARFLSSDIVTGFAGRGDQVHMYPLSFSEFMSVYAGDRYEGLDEYMLYGGLPVVVLLEGAGDKAALLKNLFDEICIPDIVRRNRIRNQGELEDLLNILASEIGSLTNPEKLKNTLRSVKNSKITAPTIKKYLGCLEDSFLVEPARRYDIKGRAYIETPKKYYFTDLGLCGARLDFRQYEPTHIMENVIYNELKMRGYQVDVGIVYSTERDRNGERSSRQLEVDFVCNLGSCRYYIQSAWSMPEGSEHSREVRPLRKIDDSFKKIVITHDPFPAGYDEHGIFTMNIYDFLLDPSLLER